MGERVLEVIGFREKFGRRENRLVSILQLITVTVWKFLFNKQADSLEISTESEDQCEGEAYLILILFNFN